MKIRLALVLFTMTLLASCSRTPSSVLDDPTCDAPCWRGIVVGETTRDEALQILTVIPEVEKETLESWSSNYIFWRYQGVREYASSMGFRDNKVSSLSIAYDQNTIYLKKFIEKFDEPTLVYVTSTDGVYPIMLTVRFIHLEREFVCSTNPHYCLSNAQENTPSLKRLKSVVWILLIHPYLMGNWRKVVCAA
jgi:hypothetical protein